MSSIHDPAETSSMYASSEPATDHGIDVDNPDSEGDASSEVSCGGNLRGDLEAVLMGDFDFKGKFALSETFTATPPPALHIEGIGLIGFPLSERDAKLIEAAAIQAPFGRGTHTVVDTTVRDTFEINPNRFSFKNPAWNEFLQKVTKKVADGLGLPPNRPPPRAELYKLLLYKTGSHFLPHKDTEKSQGMFASLIIVLPSKFEGGAVHVSHGTSKDVFDISPSSAFTTSALAWYTDVTHEVKPVTSGYRLAISYNLVNASPGLPPPHLPDLHSAVSAVERIFHKWKKGGYEEPESGVIAYIMEHEYSGASFESAALKGRDATVISNIKDVAEKHGVCLNLGILVCEMSGEADPWGEEDDWGPPPKMEMVNETEYKIETLYDLEGDIAEGEDPIILDPESDMIPQDPGFEGQDPDDEEFEGYTGNEGAPMKYWYHRSALVMSLGGSDSTKILEVGGANYAFGKLKRWKAEGPTERNKKIVRFLVGSGHRQEHTLLSVDLALEWGDLELLEDVILKSIREGCTVQLSSDVVVRAWGVFTFDRTKHIVEKAIDSQLTTRAALEFIRALRDRAPVQDQQNVRAWLKQQAAVALSSIKMPLTVDDVQMFVGIAESEGLPFFSATILKQIVGPLKMFDFRTGLAEGLWKNKGKLIPSIGTTEETLPHTKALNRILDSLIVAAIPECYSPEVDYGRYIAFTFPRREPLQDHIRIIEFLDLMVLTRRTKNSDRLITLVSNLQNVPVEKYQKLIMSLTPELKVRYRKYSKSDFPILDVFLGALVERWLQDLLGACPKKPEPFTKMLYCGCEDCTKVNRFLQSNTVTETFWAAQKRRSHMESNIGRTLSDDVACTTLTGRTPYGLQVTKTKGWNGRLASARAFLALIGTTGELARIMGKRYQDVQAALAGTKPYKISDPTRVVAPVEGAPVASTSAGGTHTGPVVAGVKRKAEDDGHVIDLTSD